MPKYSVNVKMPDYLAQWLMNEFWSEECRMIVFPRGSAAACVLSSCLCKAPACMPVYSGGLPVAIPTVRGLNPAVYNHVTKKGQAALVATCRRMFKAMLYQELGNLFEHDVAVSDLIYAFLEKHGIEDSPKNWEAVRQIYIRLRQASRNRHNDDDAVNVC